VQAPKRTDIRPTEGQDALVFSTPEAPVRKDAKRPLTPEGRERQDALRFGGVLLLVGRMCLAGTTTVNTVDSHRQTIRRLGEVREHPGLPPPPNPPDGSAEHLFRVMEVPRAKRIRPTQELGASPTSKIANFTRQP
jgi:hypothetical protein